MRAASGASPSCTVNANVADDPRWRTTGRPAPPGAVIVTAGIDVSALQLTLRASAVSFPARSTALTSIVLPAASFDVPSSLSGYVRPGWHGAKEPTPLRRQRHSTSEPSSGLAGVNVNHGEALDRPLRWATVSAACQARRCRR